MAKPHPVKAKPGQVRAGMTAAEAFQCLAGECLRHLRANEPAIIQLRHPEGVHQARVAIRKLRTALALFRDMLKKQPVKAARRELKQVFEALGRCRDLDVLMAGPVAKSGHGKLPKGFKAARQDAYDRLVTLLKSEAYSSLVERVASAVAGGSWLKQGAAGVARARRPVLAFARDQLDAQLDEVADERLDLAGLTAEARHQLRIRVKNLRYTAEFFAGLFEGPAAGKSQRAFMRAVKRLQDQLGLLNDLAVAGAMTSDLARDEMAAAPNDKLVRRQLKAGQKAYAALIAAGRFWRAETV